MAVSEDVLERLYGVAPGGFVAARDACAKELKDQGDKAQAAEVKALKRPGLPLWAVNQLSRRHPAEVQAWLALGARLKNAQRELLTEGAAELKEASRQQREMLATLVELAGRILEGNGQATKVRELLQAVLSGDDETRARFRKGILTDEPQAGDVSDMLSMMLTAGVPRPAPAPVGPSSPPVDQLAERRDTVKRHAEEERARLAAEQQAKDQQRQALQAAVVEAEGQRAELQRVSSEKRAVADAAIQLAAEAEARAKSLALAAREADAAAHQARLATEAVERRLRELAADIRQL